MENFDDRYDPDRWMASGKSLSTFLPTGPGAEEYYAAHPDLGERVWRYWKLMSDRVGKAWQELHEHVPQEELMDMWRSVRQEAPRQDL